MRLVIAVLMILMGLGIAGVWTRDILVGTRVDVSNGVFVARDPDSGSLLWPHWLAEYATAVTLVLAAVGLLTNMPWSPTLAAIASGALLYTSINSLGWAFAEADRRAYTGPMILGVVVGLLTCAYLLAS